MSQFLSWIENNSHRLRLQKGEMENVAWISQTDLNWAGTCWNLKPVPGVAKSAEIPGLGPGSVA